MRKNILLIIVCLIRFYSFGQTELPGDKKSQPFLATIKTISNEKVKGWLYKIEGDNIYLLRISRKGLQENEFNNSHYNNLAIGVQVPQINSISVQKKNAVTKGILFGMGVGIATGIIKGFAEGDDPDRYYGGVPDFGIPGSHVPGKTAEAKAAGYAVLAGVAGAVTGFIISKLIRKKFTIGGKKEVYRNIQGEIMSRLIVK
jgi:hypothetical protein